MNVKKTIQNYVIFRTGRDFILFLIKFYSKYIVSLIAWTLQCEEFKVIYQSFANKTSKSFF